ncbi:Efflux pump periplasmic linker BepF [Methyloligella halotolerans]|uniref:Efflux pump periplasmic linker BepF n=1 Tax=Methyloligella halotolerans TaxID=1177755 RepID=A0A1E2RY37_9HYPH|nr:efflux RND transporter periplasmic adaptor subunit [Methyloligella halotolerans]ODA67156.1 Efflux pump periplasmic linker BepF [Methyloligella halotolerans]
MAEKSTDRAPGKAASAPGTEPETTQNGRSRGGSTVVLLIIVAILIAGGLAYRYWGFWQVPEQAGGQPPAPEVTVAEPIVREIMEWRELTGQFEAQDSVEVRARVSGYLESRDFTDGEIVKKGKLLFVIEPRPFELALEQAKATLAQSQAELRLAESQLNRTSQLREKDFAAQATLDERQAQVDTAKAAVETAEAAVQQAKLDLDYTHVVAPMAGRVSEREVSVGNLVMGGAGVSTTLLTNIVSLDPIYFVFDVSESDALDYQRLVESGELPSARKGERVQVEGQLSDEKTWDLKGYIDFVDNQFNASTGTIRVRAVFPNEDMSITPGQFGRVRIPMSKRKPTMLVPAAAVTSDQASKQLYIVDKDNKVVPKTVELGPIVGDNLQIVRSGIEPDERVIINGLMRARPGAEVTPKDGEIDDSSLPESAQK